MSGKQPSVPKLPSRILAWHCGQSAAEDLLGDLDEIYFANLKRMSPVRAKWKYWIHALSLLFSYAVRSRRRGRRNEPQSSFNLMLFQSYGKIALRSMTRQKTFSIINVICLSVGMSVGLMALAAFIDVTEVDDFITRKENIFRVITRVNDKHESSTYASSSNPLAIQLLNDVSGIEEVVQLNSDFNGEVEQSGIPLRGYYASDNFFDVFDFPLEQGSAATALVNPFSIVLTKSMAEKLFPGTDPIGKIVPVNGLGDFVVTGIVKDYPRSHFYFESLASFSTLESFEKQGKISQMQDWGPRTEFYTYLLLSPGKSVGGVNIVLNGIATDHFKNSDEADVVYALQALVDIPTSDYYNEIGLTWGYASLAMFFFLALLVLLPACFNYANISIARALRRAKEIGLRKVSGGQTRNIFLQMITETIILSLISLGGGVLIFLVVRNEFLSMIVAGRRTFDLEITPLTLLVFVLFAIGTGMLAGIFPASYFSKLNPIETLRNSSLSGRLSKVNVRKGLVVFQFVLSLFFILSVVILGRQYKYALNYDLGFQKDNILEVPLKGVDHELFRAELMKIPDVQDVSMSSSIPGSWSTETVWVKTAPGSDSLAVSQMYVDENLLHCLEIELLGGKSFPAESSLAEQYIIANEAFVKNLGIATITDALDQTFLVEGQSLRIIGVVKDFNHMPLQEKITSFVFRYDPDEFSYANVKFASEDIMHTLSELNRAWTIVARDKPFEYYFLDEQVRDSLVSLRAMIKIFSFLGILAITISCLGLLAIVISTAESRIKEMGVRKVMGATAANLAYVLSKSFLKLIVIAIMIATPVTYFLFDKLLLRLQYYRASVGFLELIIGIVILLALLVITIGGQTLKVARVNPVETLKYE